jgi:type II secretory pathway pseudopilin PulG
MVSHQSQKGFSYLIALFMVATLSIVTLRAMENSLTKDRRAKEAQLLFVGQAYQQAIMTYYLITNTYPPDLPTLVEPLLTTTRHLALRKLYFDPITGSQDWGIINDKASGGVIGVYSKSMQQPIKVNGFPPTLSNLIGAKTYQQWQFFYEAPALKSN